MIPTPSPEPEPTLAPTPTPSPTPSPSPSSIPAPAPILSSANSTSEEVVIATVSVPVVPVPTPGVSTLQPGTHTIPATTITLTHETTVCAATSTVAPSGTHTYGGVTTIVETATTVVCPVATVETSNGVVTSTIVQTTFVCPTAGTYTIAPLTTVVTEASTVLVYPTPATFAPGTYTQPEIITTVTETNYVVFCPYTSDTPIAYSTSPPAPAVTTKAPAPVETPVETPVVSTPVAAPTTAQATKSKTHSVTPSGAPALGNSGDMWAITYTPYTTTGDCKDASSVDSDISKIAAKGFTTVRLYSADKTDCNGLENVSKACETYGLTMIVGVYIKSDGVAGAQPQIDELCQFTRWSLVSLVVIGNEAIFSGAVTASGLAQFISESKTAFKAAGYSGPVTTTETLNVLQQYTAELCPVVDIVGCNIHAFFNSDVTASSAGSFVAGQLAIVEELCPGKAGINLETGWPSAGICNGAACPGQSEQSTAIRGIRNAVGGKSVMFSYTNDEWKEPGEFGCERSWGIEGLF